MVFARDRVHQLRVTIAPERWDAVLADLEGRIGPRGPEAPPAQGNPIGKPIWVPVTVSYNDSTWEHVGFRFKGNSSLRAAWGTGEDRLPFKLDFDEFEDDHPEIHNQRFFGFKELSFATNYRDPTGLRETLAYEAFRGAGLLASETAFYEIVLDRGGVPESLGVYTMVEEIDDTVISRRLGDDAGNLYEAGDGAASFAAGTKDMIPANFEKKNNESAADWSDLGELYEILHSPDRAASTESWRQRLETVFDVDAFLKWLGVSAVILHWDTYGWVAHNFYLYHRPDNGLLTWIPWDHNLVLGATLPPWQGGPGDVPGGPPLDYSRVTEAWPLIRYLLDDPVFHERYVEHLRSLQRQFDVERLEAQCRAWAALLAPHAREQASGEPYEAAVEALVAVLHERAGALNAFLGEPQVG